MIPKIAVITGPTATEKTALGPLAKTGGELFPPIRCEFKHMDVGTASRIPLKWRSEAP